ncbi:MAG: hypothetical protein QXK88_06550 [Desulfurococcaceae archaeon]
MRRAASKTMKRNEERLAQSDLPIVPGIIVVLDIDKFGDYIQSLGLDPYRPNTVSGELTALVEKFAWKYRGVVIYGLSPERGTEEAVIEIPYGHEELESILGDLNNIKTTIEKYRASISIAVVKDFVTAKPAKNRREAYYGTPGRARAIRALKAVKRRGGGRIIALS